jgi:hypothetical protein
MGVAIRLTQTGPDVLNLDGLSFHQSQTPLVQSTVSN